MAEVEKKNKWGENQTVVDPAFNLAEYMLQQRQNMEEEDEEEMGAPVLDWKWPFLWQKRRILSGMEDEDEDEDQNEDTEVDEISVCTDLASSL